jgi:hypothetical protein
MQKNFGRTVFLHQTGSLSSLKLCNEVGRKRSLGLGLSKHRQIVAAAQDPDEDDAESGLDHKAAVTALDLEDQADTSWCRFYEFAV